MNGWLEEGKRRSREKLHNEMKFEYVKLKQNLMQDMWWKIDKWGKTIMKPEQENQIGKSYVVLRLLNVKIYESHRKAGKMAVDNRLHCID